MVAQGFAQSQKLRGALLKLAEGIDLRAIADDLGGIMESPGDSPPALGFVRIDDIRAATRFGAILENSFDELLRDGAATDLLKIGDLSQEGAAALVEFDDGGGR